MQRPLVLRLWLLRVLRLRMAQHRLPGLASQPAPACPSLPGQFPLGSPDSTHAPGPSRSSNYCQVSLHKPAFRGHSNLVLLDSRSISPSTMIKPSSSSAGGQKMSILTSIWPQHLLPGSHELLACMRSLSAGQLQHFSFYQGILRA